jgi:hypothetical protein
MVEKGLCVTCISDRHCSFARKFPVLLCEEFDLSADNTVKCSLTKLKKKSVYTAVNEEISND